MAVTINDVAKRAGVSHTTVSWVIHDDPRITQETKKKVLAVIKELDYHPNMTARNLVRGKTNTIAVVAGFFSTYFEISILKGMEQSDDKELNSYQINLYSTRGEQNRQETILKEILYGKRADGVILLAETLSAELLQQFCKENVPLLLVESEAQGIHVIKMNNRKGAFTAVSQILEKGKQNVALVCGELKESTGYCMIERKEGCQEALERNGLKLQHHRIYQTDDFYLEAGKKAYTELMKKDPSIDAVFCAGGDEMALGILQAALKEGRKIPEELAIVGYDDIPAAALVHPALSTMKQPIQEVGFQALKLMVESLKTPGLEPRYIVMEAQYIARESN